MTTQNKRLQVEFIESIRTVTEEHYDYMLGCVPPIRMVSNAFLVGEAVDHVDMFDSRMVKVSTPRYDLYYYVLHDGSYSYHYGGLATLRMFDLWTTILSLPGEMISCDDCGMLMYSSDAVELITNQTICDACDTNRNIKIN